MIARPAHLLAVLILWSSLSSAQSVPSAPEKGGPRNWQVVGVAKTVNMREEAARTARVVSALPLGAILDNLGCRKAADGVWCDVQPLGGGPRGFVAAQYLTPAVGPDGKVAMGEDDSALRAGEGKFDSNGTIPCAQAVGQLTTQCKYGVARAGGGYATVVVTRPDGRPRLIFFRLGRAIGTDSSQADRAGAFSATREGDMTTVGVGTERYQIPDAVVLGG
jgi:hypothetical protein